MRIAHRDRDAFNHVAICKFNGLLFELRHVHIGSDQHGRTGHLCISEIFDGADTQACVGLDAQLIAGICIDLLRHPRRHAARSVAANLGDGTVGVVQTNAACMIAGPLKELDAVGAHACVALAQRAGQFSFVIAGCILFGHD